MNKKRFSGFCAIFVGFVLVVVGVRLLLEPNEYRATVKIKLEPDRIEPGTSVPFDPYFLETELIRIKSDAVLSNVVRALNLDTEWGERYANGGPLEVDDAVSLLRRRIKIDANRGTKLIEISYTDENSDEAARIANAIAEAYGNYRIEVHRNEMTIGIEKLEERYREEATNIAQMEANIGHLYENSSATDLLDKIAKIKVKLGKQENLRKMLGENIEEDKAVASVPKTPLVTVVQSAVPPRRPAGPNRWLGATFVVCGLVIVGCGIGSLRAGARMPKPK